jgi:hypothetical protein
MDTIPFTTRQGIVKAFVVWIVGLAVLLGSSTVTLALKKRFDPSKTYCGCHCAGGGGSEELYWEKVGACSGANGKNCSYTGYGGKLVPGKLDSCMECKPDADGMGMLCSASGVHMAPGGVSPVVPNAGVLEGPAPGSPPLQKPGMNAPIMRRSVEPQQLIEPPSDASMPSKQTAPDQAGGKKSE